MGLPRDGTVYQLTSDVLVLMEQLLDYMDSVGPLLAQVPLYNNMVAHHITPPEKYKYLLGLYISKHIQVESKNVQKSLLFIKLFNFYRKSVIPIEPNACKSK